jgi:lipopolysaccharide export system permease protein
VPLSRLRPREGRFGRIGLAVLVYFLYYQVLIAARTWVESGTVPSALGIWWVHALALIGAILLLAPKPRWRRSRPALGAA